ncbi:hypothetical protein RND81_08G032600 [Saponaria officinalis]|uniref:FLZ-type domain-containing protein n=1 Tax=Saponaria officinalis TaxID=3572 RepID=A0AAW1J3P7_SAPOF
MLGKRSRLPTIGKLAGALRSAGVLDSATSPRSPLDCPMQSPRSPKNYDQGGIGLGILVSLNNNNNNNNKNVGEIVAKYALSGQISCKSNPIPMNNNNSSGFNNNKSNECGPKDDPAQEESTYVTCHGPKNCVGTKVYCEGVEYGHVVSPTMNQNIGVFKISSPARLFDDRCGSNSDFLSSCHLCRKPLHGKDIYMYRGEKAYCSEECRQRQIYKDEKKEKCRSKATRSTNLSTSPYSYSSNNTGDQIFSTGIFAV